MTIQKPRKLSAYEVYRYNIYYCSSLTYGNNAIWRARLIAKVNIRWYLAEVPVTRRGKILPRSEIKRFNNSVSYSRYV